MKIQEFAKLCGVSARSLRHYEKSGLLAPARTAAGYRDYDRSQVAVVRQIQWLLRARLSVKKIQYILPCTLQETKILMCQDLKGLFENEVARLDEEIDALQQSRRLLRRTLKNSVVVE
jgi:DNA-binding transcriptional MerR regulator